MRIKKLPDTLGTVWPSNFIMSLRRVETKFQVFKAAQQGGGRNQPQPNNPMQKAEEKKKAF